MNYCTMLKTTVAVIGLTTMTNAAIADDALRGGMTAVSNVASALSDKAQYSNSKWIKSAPKAGTVVNSAQRDSASTFKWAERTRPAGERVVGVDGDQARTRWLVRNDGEQNRARWLVRNDSEQSRARWLVRNDSEQNRARWLVR